MAILEIRDLIRVLNRDDALADLIALGNSMKLRASSWRIGSISRFWIVALSEVHARLSLQVSLLTAVGFNQTSWGNGLTKLSKSRFDNTQITAIKTQGGIVLFDDGGTGPFTIAVGAYVFPYAQDPSITFRNITGGTIPVGGSLELTVEAETGGEAHNVPPETISSMNPTIAGVTVTNPGDPDEWITRFGVNKEPDATLRARNRAKWGTLGGNAPSSAYEHWALTATDGSDEPVGLTRVYVDATNPSGPGTLNVYVADDSGTASVQQVTDTQAYIDARKPVTSIPTVVAATEVAIPLTGTFYVQAGYAAVAATAVEDALERYINGLPIGGTTLGSGGRVVYSELVATAMRGHAQKAHMLAVSFSSPTADVSIAPGQVAVLGTYSMTAVEV